MLLKQILLYGAALFIIIKAFLFFKKVYKKLTRVGNKKATKKAERRDDKLYEKNKQRERQQALKQEANNDIENDIEDVTIYKEDIDIVGIAKPVGKWTKMVMQNGGFMMRLAQLIRSEGGQKGFWELFVKAQASETRNKNKGKGR